MAKEKIQIAVHDVYMQYNVSNVDKDSTHNFGESA